jgi:CheY-like chemotaxis protein
VRPKKVILLVDANEDSQGRTRFVLETSGYAVLSAPSVYAAAEVAHNAPREIALLLGFSPLSDSYLRDMGKYLRCNTLFVCLNDDGTRPDMQTVLEGIKKFLPRRYSQKPKQESHASSVFATLPALARTCAVDAIPCASTDHDNRSLVPG